MELKYKFHIGAGWLVFIQNLKDTGKFFPGTVINIYQ